MGDFYDLEERLLFLESLHNKYHTAYASLYAGIPGSHPQNTLASPATEEHSISESIAYLLSRTLIWRRWTENYLQRTGIQINLLFNLVNQSDSRTNLEIANLTAKIAIDTQRDSSSMITWVFYILFY